MSLLSAPLCASLCLLSALCELILFILCETLRHLCELCVQNYGTNRTTSSNEKIW